MKQLRRRLMKTPMLVLVVSLSLSACSALSPVGAASDVSAKALTGTSTITVSSGTSTGALLWGGIGFLYGLSEYPNSAGYRLNDSMITGLVHPQYTSQKAPWGAQHPDSDALNVAAQARRTVMRGVGIYCQDIYSAWPYQNNGIADYLSRLDAIARNVVADPNRSFYHYFIFNEPDLQWYSASGTLFAKMCDDWLTCYNKIKSIDATAKIAGPGFASYNSTAYRNFFTFCKNNNCMPDIVVWHELQNSFFTGWYNNYNDFRSIESSLGIGRHEIYINEYARSSGDLAVPGNLVQYIARFEDSKVYAGLAFWHGIGDLDDLVANNNISQSIPGSSLNQPDGAWYLYQWYGQMTGNTVAVTLPSQNGSLQALASKSGNSVRVIFGGSLNSTDTFNAKIVVNGLSGTSATYKVLATDTTGRAAAPAPATILSGSSVVSGGSMTITVSNCKALSAYELLVN
jgi:hypothetical protein